MIDKFKRRNLTGNEHDAIFYKCFAHPKCFISLIRLALGDELADTFD